MQDFYNNSYTNIGDDSNVCEKDIEELILLAIKLRDSGETAKSLETIKQAVDISKERHGEISKCTARCLFLNAYLFENFRLEIEAIQIKIRLQAIEAEIYGESHKERINTINNIALAYERIGEEKLADMCYRWALASAGELEYQHALIYKNYGDFLKDNSRDSEALEAFQRVIEIVEPQNPFSRPISLGNSYGSAAQILKNRGEFEKAEKYYNRSIEVLESHGLEREAAIAHHNFGYYYFESGQLDKALEYFKMALNFTFKNDFITELTIISIYFTQSRFNEAQKLSNEIIDKLIKEFQQEDLYDYLRKVDRIINYHFDNKFFAEAHDIFQKVTKALIKKGLHSEDDSITFCSEMIYNQKKYNLWEKAVITAKLMLEWMDLMEEQHYDYGGKLVICGECFIKVKDFKSFEVLYEKRMTNLDEELEWMEEDFSKLCISYQAEKGNFAPLIEQIMKTELD